MVWLRVAGAPFHLLPSLFYYSRMFLLRTWRPCRNWEVFSPWTSVAEESLTLSPLLNYLLTTSNITQMSSLFTSDRSLLYIFCTSSLLIAMRLHITTKNNLGRTRDRSERKIKCSFLHIYAFNRPSLLWCCNRESCFWSQYVYWQCQRQQLQLISIYIIYIAKSCNGSR